MEKKGYCGERVVSGRGYLRGKKQVLFWDVANRLVNRLDSFCMRGCLGVLHDSTPFLPYTYSPT